MQINCLIIFQASTQTSFKVTWQPPPTPVLTPRWLKSDSTSGFRTSFIFRYEMPSRRGLCDLPSITFQQYQHFRLIYQSLLLPSNIQQWYTTMGYLYRRAGRPLMDSDLTTHHLQDTLCHRSGYRSLKKEVQLIGCLGRLYLLRQAERMVLSEVCWKTSYFYWCGNDILEVFVLSWKAATVPSFWQIYSRLESRRSLWDCNEKCEGSKIQESKSF